MRHSPGCWLSSCRLWAWPEPVARKAGTPVSRGRRRGNAPAATRLADLVFVLEACGLAVQLVNAAQARNLPGRPKTDLLTELRGEVPQVSVRVVGRMATFPDHDHRRRRHGIWRG